MGGGDALCALTIYYCLIVEGMKGVQLPAPDEKMDVITFFERFAEL